MPDTDGLRNDFGSKNEFRHFGNKFFIHLRVSFVFRRQEEAKAGFPSKPMDQGGIQLIDPLIYRGNEAYKDTIDWLVSQQKKERPGDKPGSV